MVRVLVIGPKVREFKPGQGDGFLRAIQICSTPSFRREVTPEAPCHKILWHVKITCKYKQKHFERPNSHSFRTFFLLATTKFYENLPVSSKVIGGGGHKD
jgi:hypothetical protein